jgi:hypothetical protein
VHGGTTVSVDIRTINQSISKNGDLPGDDAVHGGTTVSADIRTINQSLKTVTFRVMMLCTVARPSLRILELSINL